MLVTDAFGAGGGIARYNCDLSAALSQSANVSEIVVLPRHASTSVVTPAKVRQLAPSRDPALWTARAVGLAARHGFSTVFCGHLNAVPIAGLIAQLMRVPLWVQVHGIEAWQPRGTLFRRSLFQARIVTSVSRHTRRQLLAWADVPPSRVRVLPNTVAPDYTPRERRRDLLERYALDGKRVILTVGRLSASERYKGHDRIIKAMPEIIARVPNAVYLIVGSGEDETRLDQLARQTSIQDRVVFAGQVPNNELPDYFALADVFAMPSNGEGFGIVFLEAAASGLPVIGGNSDGSVDALADGRIGRLVDPQSQDEIVAAIAHTLQGCQQASAASVQRFLFDNFARQVNELLRILAS